ncbi:hypothetical protein [Campylobacter devanensis]|uniref:hypothetical protein n=1 Tax=Campylobacter devanensis TaxID=3161138 RepID=UPI000A358A1F|nr:hypothetical protein [Campylobacter sp. P0107]
MENKELKKVDMTLIGRFNRMLGKAVFAFEIGFDSLALGARSLRDFMYSVAKRSAELAEPEEGDKELFKKVDDAVASALEGR